jgi:hypothetical protein
MKKMASTTVISISTLNEIKCFLKLLEARIIAITQQAREMT